MVTRRIFRLLVIILIIFSFGNVLLRPNEVKKDNNYISNTTSNYVFLTDQTPVINIMFGSIDSTNIKKMAFGSVGRLGTVFTILFLVPGLTGGIALGIGVYLLRISYTSFYAPTVLVNMLTGIFGYILTIGGGFFLCVSLTFFILLIVFGATYGFAFDNKGNNIVSSSYDNSIKLFTYGIKFRAY